LYVLSAAFLAALATAITFLILWMQKKTTATDTTTDTTTDITTDTIAVGSLVRFHYRVGILAIATSAICADSADDTLIIHGIVSSILPTTNQAQVAVLTIQTVGPTADTSTVPPGRCSSSGPVVFNSIVARTETVHANLPAYMGLIYGNDVVQPASAQLTGQMRRKISELTLVSRIQHQTDNLPPA
jgi:hypothetical protein